MAASADDWRLIGQERYLAGAKLVRRKYAERSTNSDHDHCEFCGAKFMDDGSPSTLSEGYSTEDCYRWVCEICFADFRERFGWLSVDGAV
jgi:hypothetical protein